MDTISTAAQNYLPLDISVLPLAGKKPALGAWKRWQTTRPSLAVVQEWLRRFPAMDLGIVTGQISGLVVIDADSDTAVAELERHGLPTTPAVQTGRGRHYYFACPSGGVSNRAGVMPGVDVRGDGGYVVAPPSVHRETGAVYEWLPGRAIGEVALAELPDWMVALLAVDSQHSATRSSRVTVVPSQVDTERMWALLEGSRTGQALPGQLVIASGARNHTLASVGGKLRRADYPDHEIGNELLRINRLGCQPPLEETEVEKIAASVVQYRRGGVRSRLRWLRECVSRAAIPGRTALTLRRVYDAHLDIAIHSMRGTYTASVRQICEKADATPRTVMARHVDLVSAGLLEVVDIGIGQRATRWRVPRDAVIQLRTITRR